MEVSAKMMGSSADVRSPQGMLSTQRSSSNHVPPPLKKGHHSQYGLQNSQHHKVSILPAIVCTYSTDRLCDWSLLCYLFRSLVKIHAYVISSGIFSNNGSAHRIVLLLQHFPILGVAIPRPLSLVVWLRQSSYPYKCCSFHSLSRFLQVIITSHHIMVQVIE